ncbi:hypothetical protein [Streptomyces sp. NPDC019224]|uniref:hypothetical protein n=1 Tax=Streptomyces sp. NPDC019224 TaxID=3154484 RepID=UPI0033F077C0
METRAVRVLDVTGLGLYLPHIVQAARILRYRVDNASGRCTREIAAGLRVVDRGPATPRP